MQLNLVEVTAIVIGLTQWIKTKLNLEGQKAELLSAGLGFTLGAGFQYSQVSPVDFAGWFLVVLVGLGMALVPSGLYKFIGAVADRIVTLKGQ